METKLFDILRQVGLEIPIRLASLHTSEGRVYNYPMLSTLYVAMHIAELLPEEDLLLSEYCHALDKKLYEEADDLLEKMKDKEYYKPLLISCMYKQDEPELYREAINLSLECLTIDNPYKNIVLDMMLQEAVAKNDLKIAELTALVRRNDIGNLLQYSRFLMLKKNHSGALMSLLYAITMEPSCLTDRLLVYCASVELQQILELYPGLMSDTADMISNAIINWIDE